MVFQCIIYWNKHSGIKIWGSDCCGGPVVKNLPYNAGDDQGSILGRGTETPHAAEQPSLHAATSELVRATARKSVRRSERS